MKLRTLIVFASAFFYAGCSLERDCCRRLHEYSVAESVAYAVKRGAPLEGDLYLPAGSGGAAPGILMIHGGSWSGGSRGYMSAPSERLARRGYVVFNVTYRFTPVYRYPAQIEDVRDALGWLRAHARSIGLDTSRISVWGYSAGAYLAASLGIIATKPGDEPLCAIIAGAGPYNLEKYPDDPAVLRLLGATIGENPNLFHEASPVYGVTAETPPAFLYYGTDDTTVNPSHSIELKAALDRAGVASELLPVPGLGHLTLFLFGRSAESAGIRFLEREQCSPENSTPE